MDLQTHGEITVRAGRALLQAEYRPADRGPGELSLRLEDHSTLEITEAVVTLDPWLADVYDVKDWPSCNALVVSGAQAVIALNASTLALCSSVALEYEEAETIDRPWFSEAQDGSRLLVGTERRVWCLDDRARIVWMWSARVGSSERWIRGTPQAVGRQVHVPVRTLRGDSVVELSLDDGSGKES